MAAARNNFVKLGYKILDLIEYNGLKIDAGMKILLSMILSYENEGRVFYESVGTIGDRIGRKPEATRKMIANLVDAGMIKFEERDGSSHIYHTQQINPELMISIGDKKQKQEEAGECPF